MLEQATAETTAATPWLTKAVGYEIYIRSFCDSDGDGIGDLGGIESRLDHLSDLGIDLIWITPFYESPMADYGYDVADYCAVDPLFGDIDAFDRLLDAAHRRGIRVIIDIVPNHSSIEHPWFRQSRSGRESSKRDYYIWRDPAADGGPPNNWVSYFGGPAWTFDAASGQYYLHLFLPDQPDLNWRSPKVLDEFDAVLRFWLDRGVDGFRIDVAQALIKDIELRSNPVLGPWDPMASREEQWDSFDHRFDILQSESLDVFVRWRAIVEQYDAVLVGETYVVDSADYSTLVRGDGLHAGFWFAPMHIEWSIDEIRTILQDPLRSVAEQQSVAWVTSSHDAPRSATRFGGGDPGRQRALLLSTLLLCLPGVPFLYQGEELGLLDGIVPDELRADPVGTDVTASRDGSRTPMPWSPGETFGFSANPATWLPHGGRVDSDTALDQRQRSDSWFQKFRALIAMRRSEAELSAAEVDWKTGSEQLLSFGRGQLVVAANISDAPCTLDGIGNVAGDILYSTHGRSGRCSFDVVLDPAEAIVVRIGP